MGERFRSIARKHRGQFEAEDPRYRATVVPYHERGDLVWPNGSRLAIAVYLAAEYTEDPSTAYADQKPKRERDLLSLSYFGWYNFRAATYRVLDILDDLGVTVTAFVNGVVGQRHPEAVHVISDLGHAIAGHAWDQWKDAKLLSPAEEEEDIARTGKVLRDLSGQPVHGWINPKARCSEDTMALLAANGFTWCGDLRDDDLPYAIEVDGKTLIRIPHSNFSTNDFAYYAGHHMEVRIPNRSPREVVAYLEDLIQAFRERAKRECQLLMLGLHPYIIGRPERVDSLATVLRKLQSIPEAWWGTFDDVASWWRQKYAS